MLKIPASIVGVALLAAATLIPVQAASAATPTATGVVRLGAAPASGVVVNWFQPSTGKEGSNTFTQSDGSFSLPIPTSVKNYVLEVNLFKGTSPGRSGYAGTFVGLGNTQKLAWQYLSTIPTATSTNTAVVLTKDGAIEGSVTAAVKGQFLGLQNAAGGSVAGTSVRSDGTFRFDDLVPGAYKIAFWGDDTAYLPYTSSAIAVGAGRTVSVTPKLVKGAIVRGTVKAGGKALKNIDVGVYNNGRYYGDMTDAKGHYSVRAIASGKYKVSISDNSSSASGHLSVVKSIGSLKAGASKTVNAKLKPGAGIKGTFTAKKKSTVNLIVVNKKHRASTSFTGSSSTKLSFASLHAGTYRVYVLQEGSAKYASATVTLKAGKVTKLPKLTARHKTVTLTGKVAGKGKGRAYAYSPKLGSYDSATIAKGRFTIAGLIPGTFTVSTRTTGYADISKTVTVKKSLSKSFAHGAKLSKLTGRFTFRGVAFTDYEAALIGPKGVAYIYGAEKSFSTYLRAGSYRFAFTDRSYGAFPANSPFYFSSPVTKVSVAKGKTKALGNIELVVRG